MKVPEWPVLMHPGFFWRLSEEICHKPLQGQPQEEQSPAQSLLDWETRKTESTEKQTVSEHKKDEKGRGISFKGQQIV